MIVIDNDHKVNFYRGLKLQTALILSMFVLINVKDIEATNIP